MTLDDHRTGDDSPRTPFDSITVETEAEFHTALRALILETDGNGVDIRGSWPVTYPDDTVAWDIEITPVVSD